MNLTVFKEEEKIFVSEGKTAPEAYEEVRLFVCEYYKTNKWKLTIKEIQTVGTADEKGLIWRQL